MMDDSDLQAFAVFKVIKRLEGTPGSTLTPETINSAAQVELVAGSAPEDMAEDEFRRALAEFKVLRRLQGVGGVTQDMLDSAIQVEIAAGSNPIPDDKVLESEFRRMNPAAREFLDQYLKAGSKDGHPWRNFVSKNRPTIVAELKKKGLSGRERNNAVFRRAGEMWREMSDSEKAKYA